MINGKKLKEGNPVDSFKNLKERKPDILNGSLAVGYFYIKAEDKVRLFVNSEDIFHFLLNYFYNFSTLSSMERLAI